MQKENTLCGYIAFFLTAGVINETEIDGVKTIKILYYKGLDSNKPALLKGLGDLYFSGIGNDHLGMDKASAFEHYERAFELYNDSIDFPGKKDFDTGQAHTAFILGYMLFNGVGTNKNYELAVSYYQAAVQKGEKKAIKPLADCYKDGIGVNKDIKRYNELMSMLKE